MNEITRGYLRVIRRWWQLYVGVALVAVILASAYLIMKPPSYASTAVLFVSTPRDDALSLYSGDVYSKSRLASFAALGSSPLLAERVSETLGRSADPGTLADGIDVAPIEGTVLMSLTATGQTPRQAQAIADAYADELSRTVAEVETRPGGLAPRSELIVVQSPTLGVPGGRFPPWAIICAAGGLGLILAGLVVSVRALVDGRIRLPEDSVEAAGAPVLGEFGSVASVADALTDPASIESARKVRPHLDRLRLQESRVIQVVSPDTVSARTQVALSLASVLAERGSSVVVLDLDGRHTELQVSIPELVSAPTVRTLLSDGHAMIPVQVSPHGVAIIPFGEPEPIPGAAIDDPAMKVLLAALRDDFDWILVDTPAIVEYSDAARAVQYCDAAVLVARLDHTRFDDLRSAAEELRRSGGSVVGTCLVSGRRDHRGESLGSSQSAEGRDGGPTLIHERGSA